MNEYKFYVDGFETIIIAANYIEAARKLRDELDGYTDTEKKEV
jgi:hypothetical protein